MIEVKATRDIGNYWIKGNIYKVSAKMADMLEKAGKATRDLSEKPKRGRKPKSDQ